MERQSFTGAEHYGRAVYLYAGQSNTTRLSRMKVAASRLPAWMSSPSDLDFLDAGSPLFNTDRALYSVGQNLHGTLSPGMFDKGRPGVTITGDSGGFQFIGDPSKWHGNVTRAWVLDALERFTDEAMTLDIPTGAIAPGSPWPDFDTALGCTVDSLRFFDARRSTDLRFLNVLQGRDAKEADRWYEAVKWFPAGGWAFGGVMREDFRHIIKMLVRMHDEKLLGPDRNRVHVLGMADLPAAVLLTAIQRGMRARLSDPDFLITFDVSSPSMMAGNRQAYGYPRFSPREFGMSYPKPPTVVRPGYGSALWPVKSSAIGNVMRMEDLLVPKPGSVAQSAWDGLSEAMIVNHNVHSLLSGIEQANRVLELHPDDARQLAPDSLVECYHALITACRHAHPESYLRHHAARFAAL
ncbi:hypothetical protein [Sphingomonas sp. G-3-2-10]|uniref:hypothetical protein n=1 Tax=Sphingomonas sp. G-3-2-10 TaxID=2728838 RepID=UPI00146C2BFA|nr:hypothetical protein [Sphingomonas sp. G-3-2-10]NML04255.1 hypothetical protein [Sphingomonas sp. G-3-2-10]